MGRFIYHEIAKKRSALNEHCENFHGPWSEPFVSHEGWRCAAARSCLPKSREPSPLTRQLCGRGLSVADHRRPPWVSLVAVACRRPSPWWCASCFKIDGVIGVTSLSFSVGRSGTGEMIFRVHETFSEKKVGFRRPCSEGVGLCTADLSWSTLHVKCLIRCPRETLLRGMLWLDVS